jgi:hypothetical protein
MRGAAISFLRRARASSAAFFLDRFFAMLEGFHHFESNTVQFRTEKAPDCIFFKITEVDGQAIGMGTTQQIAGDDTAEVCRARTAVPPKHVSEVRSDACVFYETEIE